MKILALDIGDRWVGIAISDPLGILPRPYDTFKASDLIVLLEKTIKKENIGTIVVGLPTTMSGTESDQTKKVIAIVDDLKDKFVAIDWQLWDERLTSKQAASIKSTKTKEDKLRSHAIAASLILRGYLERRRYLADNSE
jgi:putative holliday junction resolvase